MPRALLAALLLFFGGCAAAADAAVAIEVPAGKSRAVRLRNLPDGAIMAVRIVASGKLLVSLVNAKDLRKVLFRGTVERRVSFRVSIPERGNYLLVLSNRGGDKAVEVQAQIRAVRSLKPPAPSKGDRDLLRSSGEGEEIAQVVVDA